MKTRSSKDPSAQYDDLMPEPRILSVRKQGCGASKFRSESLTTQDASKTCNRPGLKAQQKFPSRDSPIRMRDESDASGKCK